MYYQSVNELWDSDVNQKLDETDDIIDGCGFEIIPLEALKLHLEGNDKHRSSYVHYL